MGKLFKLRHGGLLFLSRHEILDQFARDIAEGLPDDLRLRRTAVIFCGVHKSFGLNWLRPGYKIAIQTEQLYDEAGKELWGARSARNLRHIRSALRLAHRMLDLGPANRKFYDGEHLPDRQRRKIVYGPHVFPSQPVRYRPSQSNDLVFFGFAKGNRRENVIASIREFETHIVDVGTYHDRLREIIDRHVAVLNVHFEEGAYSEIPRILTSYLCGKPIVSERLCSTFRPGVHYHLLGSGGDLHGEELFGNLSALVSRKHAFRAFLEDCLK